MAPLNTHEQIALRKALRSDMLNIEGVARAAILRKELVKEFARGNPSLNSAQLNALKKALTILQHDVKKLLSGIDRQQTLNAGVLQELEKFLNRPEINLSALLHDDIILAEKMIAWKGTGDTISANQLSLIKKSLLRLSVAIIT